MKQFAVMMYGTVAYLIFFSTFLYLIGFIGGFFVPKTLDGPLQVGWAEAIITDALLILLFGLQHSIMARKGFKRWWTQYVPQPIERSTFVLFTCAVLIAMFAFWQPLGGIVWRVENGFWTGVLYAGFALGWSIVLVSTFLINHFDLFGLRQTWLYFRGKTYTHLPFNVPMLYKFVRHPLYFGFILAFWSAPVMSLTRLFFASAFTMYILMAIRLEEKDLVAHFGEKYRLYRQAVPMLLPSVFRKKKMAPDYLTIMKGKVQED
jgi:protein-S-isoprenylcysteine O-methyltransferase Ste14